jgi:hypothetical protein
MDAEPESHIPIDIWEEIFRMMDTDFEGLKRCSAVNRTFRTVLSPRIFASVCIASHSSFREIHNRLISVAPLVKHLIIRPNADSVDNDFRPWIIDWRATPEMLELFSAHLNHIHSLSLVDVNYESLDDLYAFLDSKSFPSLRMLYMLRCSVYDYPDDYSVEEDAHAIHSAIQLEDIIIDCTGYALTPLVTHLCCPISGFGHHVKRLKVTLSSSKPDFTNVAPWLSSTRTCRVAELNLRFDTGRRIPPEGTDSWLNNRLLLNNQLTFYLIDVPGIICTSVVSLTLSSATYYSNPCVVCLLDMSSLPELSKLSCDFNVTRYESRYGHGQYMPERRVIVVSEDQAHHGDGIYETELRKRMPALKHVEVILRVDDQQVTLAEKVGFVVSTRFTRACWKLGILKLFMQLPENHHKNSKAAPQWREEVDVGPHILG